MQVSQIYVYPIKSLRPVPCNEARLTEQGFAYDRHFILLKVKPQEDGSAEHQTMSVADFYEMVRFFQALKLPSTPDANDGIITITHRPVNKGGDAAEQTITIPLTPSTADLHEISVTLHKSATKAFRMPDDVNDWFSKCFGYDVILACLGPHRRSVLSSTPSHGATHVPKGEKFGPHNVSEQQAGGWMSSISNWASSLLSTSNALHQITFADVAPYLIASEKSIEDVSARLPAGQQYDMTKFRPNIVVSGASEVWEEDFWGELTLSPDDATNDQRPSVRVICQHNCGRCRSINVNLETGAQSEDDSGKMLKLLQRDRRVDPLTKYSPVFGRYAYLAPESEGAVLHVGDKVDVTVRNTERTGFDWPLQ